MEKPSTAQLNVKGVQVILSHVRPPSPVIRLPVTSHPSLLLQSQVTATREMAA
jgi:hypothetical protein